MAYKEVEKRYYRDHQAVKNFPEPQIAPSIRWVLSPSSSTCWDFDMGFVNSDASWALVDLIVPNGLASRLAGNLPAETTTRKVGHLSSRILYPVDKNVFVVVLALATEVLGGRRCEESAELGKVEEFAEV